MAKRIKVSKGFMAAGFEVVDSSGRFSDFAKCAGSSVAIFRFDPRATSIPFVQCHRIPMLRLRVGARKVILEMRSHATSQRCTKGTWVRVEDFATPQGGREWTRLAKSIAASIREGLPTAGRGGWEWRGTGNVNETRTDVTCNVPHPKLGGGVVSRGMRGMPNQVLTMGWTPASGKAVRTHIVK